MKSINNLSGVYSITDTSNAVGKSFKISAKLAKQIDGIDQESMKTIFDALEKREEIIAQAEKLTEEKIEKIISERIAVLQAEYEEELKNKVEKRTRDADGKEYWIMYTKNGQAAYYTIDITKKGITVIKCVTKAKNPIEKLYNASDFINYEVVAKAWATDKIAELSKQYGIALAA